MRAHHLHLFVLIVLAAAGCASEPVVRRIDLTERQGMYVVAHVEDGELRADMERQLVKDLTARGMRAYPSADDIGDVTSATPEHLFTAADRRRAIAVLVLDLVNRDGTGNIVGNPRRISPVHADLRALYEYSRNHSPAYDPNREAIVEANLFAVDGGELFWSGTAWSFLADGSGTAVHDLSGRIAEALAEARARLLGSGGSGAG